jgi:branched-chain amino acid transport system ATP-binding protein
MIETIDLVKRFGSKTAVSHLNLRIPAGEFFCFLGPNGAGKTTLFNIITGIYIPIEGNLIFKGQKINRKAPCDIARLGIGRTFQNIRLFNKLSVLDNVRVGCHGVTRGGFWSGMLGLPGSRKEEKLIRERSLELLAMVGLADKLDEYADNLSYGEQRRLEIARALALEPALLLLDEPGAGMNPLEKEELMGLIYQIRDERQLTIILVEHDMNLVMNICERIAVLNYGRKIAEGTPNEVKNNEKVIQSYLGVGA